MFNQASFNIVPFNRTFSVDVHGGFALSGTGELYISGNMIVQPGFDVEGMGELVWESIRERFGTFALEAIGEMEISGAVDRFGSFDLQAIGELVFSGGRNRVDIIEFDGDFRPGDRIVIDSNNLTFTLNGVNVLHQMSGDFFDLNLGKNVLIYTDNQTGRTVLTRITYRDKFV